MTGPVARRLKLAPLVAWRVLCVRDDGRETLFRSFPATPSGKAEACANVLQFRRAGLCAKLLPYYGPHSREAE